MSKKLDASAITDELAEESAFFRTTRKPARGSTPLPASDDQEADNRTLTPTSSALASQPDSDQLRRKQKYIPKTPKRSAESRKNKTE